MKKLRKAGMPRKQAVLRCLPEALGDTTFLALLDARKVRFSTWVRGRMRLGNSVPNGETSWRCRSVSRSVGQFCRTFQLGSDPPTRSDPEVVRLFARGTDKLNDLKDFLPELNNLSCCGMHQDLGSRREKRVRAEPRL